MSKLNRLETVKDALDTRLTQATQTLVQARARQSQETQRFHQLQTFLDEYSQQFGSQESGAVRAFQLRDYSAFVAKLGNAVNEQHRRLEHVAQEVSTCEQHYFSERSRSKAMVKLIDNARSQEQRIEDEHEQQTSDEMTLHGYVGPQSGQMTPSSL